MSEQLLASELGWQGRGGSELEPAGGPTADGRRQLLS